MKKIHVQVNLHSSNLRCSRVNCSWFDNMQVNNDFNKNFILGEQYKWNPNRNILTSEWRWENLAMNEWQDIEAVWEESIGKGKHGMALL